MALAALLAGVLPLVLATPALAARQKSIRINDASLVEGDVGQKSMTFTISWTGSKGGAAPSVQYATADVTAVAGQDYIAKTGTASLTNGGCRCATVTVQILGDLVFEGTETLAVNLSNPVNGTIADGQGLGSIYDNEGPPALVVTDVSGPESGGTLSFDVLLTNAAASSVSVNYATADGTAVAGSDYAATSGTLTFLPATTAKSVVVVLIDNSLAEDDETLTLNLSNPTGGMSIIDPQGLGTITNDDPDPIVSVGNASVTEGDVGTTTLSFPVTLSGPSGREVDVDYATSDGTATAATDYVAASGTVLFAAGETSKWIGVAVSGDFLDEGSETFTVALSAPFNADLGTSVATGTILDDDSGPKLYVADASITEGSAGTTPLSFSVTMTPASGGDVSVQYTTSDGTALAGSDYAGNAGTLTIPAGQTSGSIIVDVVGDTTPEASETLGLTLSNPTGAKIVTGTATGTIIDDDATPTVGGKIPTVLTLKLVKGASAIKAKGIIEAAASDMKIKVSLYHKVGTKYALVKSKSVNAKGLKDRNGDGIIDAEYAASFPRPAGGPARFVARYAGSLVYAPSKTTLSFKL